MKMTRLMKYFGIYATVFAVPVSGLSFTFSREKILLGSTGNQTLSCKVTESDVRGIYSIKMFRETFPGSKTQELLASMDTLDNPPEPKLSVSQNGFVVNGKWDTTRFQENYLKVDMDIAMLKCTDARDYQCELTYASVNQGSIQIVKRNATFSAYGAEVRNYTKASGGNEDNKVTKRDVTAGVVGGVIAAVVIIGIFVIVVIVRRKLITTAGDTNSRTAKLKDFIASDPFLNEMFDIDDTVDTMQTDLDKYTILEN